MRYFLQQIFSTFFALLFPSFMNADSKGSFSLTSPSFQDQSRIPKVHICDRLGGDNQSPSLEWTNSPPYTKSFAITCLDPDAPHGVFTHWIIYNISNAFHRLESGVKRTEKHSNGSRQGINSFGHLGYDGPCPPPGPAHHYIFTLYALDRTFDFEKEPTIDTFQEAIQGHILGKAQLTGLFQNK